VRQIDVSSFEKVQKAVKNAPPQSKHWHLQGTEPCGLSQCRNGGGNIGDPIVQRRGGQPKPLSLAKASGKAPTPSSP
jgi:hypothetical protein